ncbi:probable elongation factor 1-delta isoform X2 [Anthonomus grandis grandis]|uniref:probable elongation factor 1-delta isoform X2 n=1 Tax=Anthonomus grandis grandis TaxID=2921223 RepID=UPI0021668755|nr:probable elongation factor 1-delta isoform X2 [Anthonomus grandis grandis]
MKDLVGEVWINKKIYDDAESSYYENLSRRDLTGASQSIDVDAIKFIEKKVVQCEKAMNDILKTLDLLTLRVTSLESTLPASKPVHEINLKQQPQVQKQTVKQEEDDDVDLFASDSDEESAESAKIREERLAAYAAKKSKKPVLIAKSNVILDIKPWDDETDMKAMEEHVRKIEADGLLWGTSKLVPLAYGIHKLQISSVVEDDKVSIDWLTEQIEAIEDFVQSVDIAAFNKI